MTYTINGKEWTEFDINKRCAEILGVSHDVIVNMTSGNRTKFSPCSNPLHTWRIIEKCWDELMCSMYDGHIHWVDLTQGHQCTKLVAACICFIEENEA